MGWTQRGSRPWLGAASMKGHSGVVEVALEELGGPGIDVNHTSERVGLEAPALCYRAWPCRCGCKNKAWPTPLIAATGGASNEHAALAKLLLEVPGIDVNPMANGDVSALHDAVKRRNDDDHVEVIQSLRNAKQG